MFKTCVTEKGDSGGGDQHAGYLTKNALGTKRKKQDWTAREVKSKLFTSLHQPHKEFRS